MAVDLIPLEDAASLLGVSPERVRQLVVAGDLPGIRFANAWAVPRAAVTARADAPRRRGRPLGTRRVWQAILDRDVDLDDVGRYRNRGATYRYLASFADSQALTRRADVMTSGVAAATRHGALLSDEHTNEVLYLPGRVHARLESQFAVVPDPLGNLILRVVPDTEWDLASKGSIHHVDGLHLAPIAAVSLDLMDSSDPRHHIAALHLIDHHGC